MACEMQTTSGHSARLENTTATACPAAAVAPPPEVVGASLHVFLDRYSNHVAPLGPGAVVVLHVALPEEFVQDEPGVRRALADPAVGDYRRVAVDDALALVQLAQLVGRLERAVLLYGLRPRDRGGARDVARALRALLLVARHTDQLAAELGGRAHVDELRVRVERGQHLVALRADRGVGLVGLG